MLGINCVHLTGRVGRDPEIRYTNDGKPIARMSVATSERRKDANGEYVEKTEWHTVVAFNKLGEIAEKYIRKGDPVAVIGKMQTRKYTKKNGDEGWVMEVVLDSWGHTLQNLSDKKSNPPTTKSTNVNPKKQPPAQNQPAGEPFDDDLPF